MRNPRLIEYIQSHSRNKIVFFKNEIPGIKSLDIGNRLSLEIKSLVSDSKVGMKSLTIIEELFSSSMVDDSLFGKFISIKNVGILFESELKVDFAHFLDKFSSSNILFVHWEGEIENGNLYFLTKEKGQKINIKNLSYIAI